MTHKFKEMDKLVGELQDWIEDKNINYPDSMFLIDCWKAKNKKTIAEFYLQGKDKKE